jgi:hypothetical protein
VERYAAFSLANHRAGHKAPFLGLTVFASWKHGQVFPLIADPFRQSDGEIGAPR